MQVMESVAAVPASRVRHVNSAPVRADFDYVLHWMITARRTQWNFSLDRAVDWALQLQRPLVVFEPLSCSYPWASDRFHQFILDGMQDNANALAQAPVTHFSYVEPAPGAGRGLMERLASRACVVVTDDFPAFFLPKLLQAVSGRLDVRMEAVDSNGLLPLSAAERVHLTAASFRRHVQRLVPAHLQKLPNASPFKRVHLPLMNSLPLEIRRRWPSAKGSLATLPIDHAVASAPLRGGPVTAGAVLEEFLSKRFERYAAEKNHPDADATSGLSPYLHFGHISSHEIFAAIARHEGCVLEKLRRKPTGKRRGWWNMSAAAEEFLDQFVTWRELGFNFAFLRKDHDQYTSLPAWAQTTLEKHAADPRRPLYTLEQFEHARTHDAIWNAAQRQLVREGRIHNYMRMLWGKKILEWSGSPQEALRIMIELNNKYALDGRDPNSYSGIFWVLGRYDRPWGPERPVFGKIRYMSTEAARRKIRLKQYLEKYRAT
jgi:deoxyribodipyrimidine photo-lyase